MYCMGLSTSRITNCIQFVMLVMCSSLQVADGVVCGGGASAYYSHSLQLLLFSYMNGVCVGGVLYFMCECVGGWLVVYVSVSYLC